MVSISIIIPTLNASSMIEDCLSSIVAQKPNETIILDNGSVDDTIKIAKNYGVQVYSYPELTVSELWHTGVLLAKSDVITLVDQDAIIPFGYIQTLKELFSDPELVAVSALVQSSTACPLNNLIARITQSTFAPGFGTALSFRKDAYFLTLGFIASQRIIIKKSRFGDIEEFREFKKIGKTLFVPSLIVEHHVRNWAILLLFLVPTIALTLHGIKYKKYKK